MIKKHDNEKGVALIAALMVLAILTMLGLAAILVSSTDIQIANNEKLSTQGQYAAEAGIAQALVMLNYSTAAGDRITEPSPAPEWGVTNATAESWRYPITGTFRNVSGMFFNFSTTVSYKIADSGAYPNRVAFFNRSSGFSTAPSGTGGWPVFQIVSYARNGNYQTQKSVLELTMSVKNFQINGGFTAGGDLILNGTPLIDGQHHDADGNVVATGSGCRSDDLSEPMPAIFSNGTTYSTGGGNHPDLDSSPEITDDTVKSTSIPATPWEAIWGPPTTESEAKDEFDSIFKDGAKCWGNSPCSKDLTDDNYYSDFGANVNITGNGLLIVHNPNFVPGECADGNYDGNPSPACDADHAPATLDANTGTFKGVIIADQVSLRGNVTIIGALVSLSTVRTTATGAGSPTILYSCQAIEQFAGGQINKKLNWRRQSDAP